MRPIALGRKNWLHVGSELAGPKIAAIMSIVETCRRLDIRLRAYLKDVLPRLGDWPINRVAELTRRLLPTGQCSAEAIADELAMHPRTLQRRLATEGVRCQDVIDRERRAQAARYLAEPGLHLSQIAGLLGYSEQSALNRSCRRWFGKTPRQYRAEPTATVPT